MTDARDKVKRSAFGFVGSSCFLRIKYLKIAGLSQLSDRSGWLSGNQFLSFSLSLARSFKSGNGDGHRGNYQGLWQNLRGRSEALQMISGSSFLSGPVFCARTDGGGAEDGYKQRWPNQPQRARGCLSHQGVRRF